MGVSRARKGGRPTFGVWEKIIGVLLGIYVRKSPEKKFLEKNLKIKTLVKKSQFSKVLGQKVTVNKILSFRFLGLFFLK